MVLEAAPEAAEGAAWVADDMGEAVVADRAAAVEGHPRSSCQNLSTSS